MKFCLLIIVFLSYSHSLFAKYGVRFTQSYSHSDSLWYGKEKRDYRGTDLNGTDQQATRIYYQSQLDGHIDLANEFKVEFGAIYSYSKTYDAPILQTKEGESASLLTKLSFKLGRQFLVGGFGIYPFIGYEHPGKTSIHQPVFLSPHDYSSNILTGFIVHKELFGFTHLVYFVDRHVVDGGQPEQIIFNYQIMKKLNSNLSLGGGFDIFHALTGFDIGDDRFNAQANRTGVIPVWKKKERYIGLSLIGDYQYNMKSNVSGYLHKKIDGSNTDDSLTIGVSHSWNF